MKKLTITITSPGLKIDLQKLIEISINSSTIITERFYLNDLSAWAHVCLN